MNNMMINYLLFRVCVLLRCKQEMKTVTRIRLRLKLQPSARVCRCSLNLFRFGWMCFFVCSNSSLLATLCIGRYQHSTLQSTVLHTKHRPKKCASDGKRRPSRLSLCVGQVNIFIYIRSVAVRETSSNMFLELITYKGRIVTWFP